MLKERVSNFVEYMQGISLMWHIFIMHFLLRGFGSLNAFDVAFCAAQVSCTVDFDPDTEGPQLEHALNFFQYQLKGVSFLPRIKGVYKQMPYVEITPEEFNERSAKLKAVNFRCVCNAS